MKNLIDIAMKQSFDKGKNQAKEDMGILLKEIAEMGCYADFNIKKVFEIAEKYNYKFDNEMNLMDLDN